MKNNSFSSWLTILATAAVGILLIVWHNRLDMLQWLIIAMGLLIAIPSAYTMVVNLMRRNKNATDKRGSISSIVAGIAAIALGMWMIISPTFFVGLLAYLFATIMIIYGILQLIIVGYWSRPFVLPGWLYIIPALLIVGGIVILCTSVRTMNSVVVLITGIMLVASSVNLALEYTATNPAQKRIPENAG